MRKIIVLLLVCTPIAFSTYSQKLSISLFNELSVNTVLVTPVAGSYNLITGNGEHEIKENQIVYLSKQGDSILVRDAFSNLGIWPRVSIVGKSDEDAIRVKPIMPAHPARIFDDNLTFYIEYGRIMTINLVNQEKYIAAVVKAESGPNRDGEFYKAQALIARTFALSHLQKHQSEGFNLCDGVHCQAYKGKSEQDDGIFRATVETQNLVIVDSLDQLITAAFHANCGGQTAYSEDVWVKPLPYLISVDDKYCTSSRQATWEQRLPLDKWKEFLVSQGIDSLLLADPKTLAFEPKPRVKDYPVAGTKIPMVKIRNHFKLRSAYFSVEVIKNSVRLNGRGYGHGVGLCQDGAMNMASRGWPYDKIIDFFYRGVRIVEYTESIQQLQKDSIPR